MADLYTIEKDGHQLKIEANSPDEALKAADGWKAAAAPMTPMQTAEDAYKSFDAGVAGGTATLLGMPGDVTNWGARGIGAASDWLSDKLGIPKYQPPSTPGPIASALSKIPTSESMGREIQNRYYGGEKPYKPQSEIGGYAHSIGEAGPGAVAGPGGLLVKGALAAGSGIGSEFLGGRYKGTPYEPYARLIGGVVGGVGTMAGGKGVEAARNYSAARSTGQEIGDILGTEAVKPGAVRRAAQSAADDNLTSAGVRATQDRLGPEAMTMDLGRQMQGRAEAIALPPGRAQNTVLDAVEGRTGEFGSGARARIGETLDQTLGPSRNVVHLMDDIDAMVAQRAKPAYEKVMADHPVMMDETLQALAERPAIAEGMKRAKGVAANYGETIDGATPSLKFWDYTKKAMDQRINGMMRNGVDDLSSAEKADLGGLLSAKKALVSHLDQVTGGQYEAARRIAATKPELHEAMDFGRSIFNSKLLPEEVAASIHELSIPQQAMAQVGARRELERILDSARNDGAKARAFLDTNNNLEKIRNLFGDAAAQAIENRVAAENTFQNATQTIARNSRTATRQQLVQDTETASPARIDATLTGLLLKGGKAGYSYAVEHGMQNTRQGIADILTAKGDRIAPLVEQLLKYNTKKASNVGASINQQTAILSRALLSGAGTSTRAPPQRSDR